MTGTLPKRIRTTGPRNPVPSSPERVPGSVRRTLSCDIVRPEGLRGPIVADLRGRDLATEPDGARVLDELELRIALSQVDGTITSIDGDRDGRLDDLVGTTTRSGFSRRLAALFDDEQRTRTLRFSALEDLGGALLVSGYSLLRTGVLRASLEDAEARAAHQADICAGWAEGGPVLVEMRTSGISPVPMGPTALDVFDGDDLAWHAMAPLDAETVRRIRRLDVGQDAEGLSASSHFRDSYGGEADGNEDGDADEVVMHEYLVDARIDEVRAVTAIDVDARTLPWAACPAAVPSAQRLVGTNLSELPSQVRAEFRGTSTCTHLNSTLRCLADVSALVAALGRRPQEDERRTG